MSAVLADSIRIAHGGMAANELRCLLLEADDATRLATWEQMVDRLCAFVEFAEDVATVEKRLRILAKTVVSPDALRTQADTLEQCP